MNTSGRCGSYWGTRRSSTFYTIKLQSADWYVSGTVWPDRRLTSQNTELDACPMSRYDRDDRRDMWKENEMKNLGDLIGFRRRMAREGMDELPDDNPPGAFYFARQHVCWRLTVRCK
jgi:hypothetical protein